MYSSSSSSIITIVWSSVSQPWNKVWSYHFVDNGEDYDAYTDDDDDKDCVDDDDNDDDDADADDDDDDGDEVDGNDNGKDYDQRWWRLGWWN